jgi:hypothetical protein
VVLIVVQVLLVLVLVSLLLLLLFLQIYQSLLSVDLVVVDSKEVLCHPPVQSSVDPQVVHVVLIPHALE